MKYLFFFFSAFVLFACASTGPARKGPEWIRNPYAKYNERTYIAAVGSGSSRENAEKNALGTLIAIFGQSVQVEELVSNSYREAVRNGVVAYWSDDTTVDSTITSSAEFDFLAGVEIGEVWDNGRDYFAIAVLNKARAIQIYSRYVISNQTMIDNLVNIPPTHKNILSGFARYQFAATIADMTMLYVNLLSIIGGPTYGFVNGDEYRLEAFNIIKTIPVNIRVRNDRSGRIHGAFAKAFSELGFQTGGNNSPYILEVNITTSAVEIADNTYKFTRIELNANLIDAGSGTTLLPYNFTTRDGHTSQNEADNRAYLSAEQKINEEYAELLSGYLSRLLPQR